MGLSSTSRASVEKAFESSTRLVEDELSTKHAVSKRLRKCRRRGRPFIDWPPTAPWESPPRPGEIPTFPQADHCPHRMNCHGWLTAS
jgi:hypothetical protein